MNRKHIFAKIFLLLLPLLAGGCIDSSLEHCPRKGELVIKAFDNGGTDISSSGEAGDVILFEYDQNGKFLSKIKVPAGDIVTGKTMKVVIPSGEGRRFIAWSNITDEASMLDFMPERNIADNTVRPVKDLSGFSRIDGTIFYGSKSVDFKSLDENPLIEVKMQRAISRIAVSVVGMESGAKPEEYQIQVANDNQSHLNFENNVIRRDNLKYQSAVEWLQKDKIMGGKNPIMTLPSAEGSSKTILLYHKGVLIYTATVDEKGLPIAPKAGEKVSVLINLGGLNPGLKIVVGDWEQVVEWKIW